MPIFHTNSSTLPVTDHPTPSPHTNSTLNPIGVAAIDFFNDLLNKIPLPRWAVYAIFVAGGLLIIICCLCVCVKCCCKGKKKKKQQQKEKVNLKGVDGKTTTALVSAGALWRAQLLEPVEPGTCTPVLS
ncbi:synaptotagmin-2-like [Etheostoma cragini]|uniref:synaptotagmin-2-like n=1 Tax=Etheostoma cragini TaxID=417921 RepID=UPI00155F3F80|nr:synaptotagmin-2-like [Etheostoma cragini]